MLYGSLHTRSHFSFLDGASSPEELVAQASHLGHRALALTDLNGVYGAVKLQKASIRYSIQPVIGADCILFGVETSLLAKNAQGYNQICRLLNSIHQDPDNVVQHISRCSLSECIAIIHGCNTEPAQLIRSWKCFSDTSIYIGIEHDGRPWAGHRLRRCIEQAKMLNVPVVVAQNVRYATEDEYARHDLMTCIREGITLHTPHPARPVHDKQCLRKEDELRALIQYDAAFINVDAILQQCTFDILPDRITPPSAKIPTGRLASDVLRDIAQEGFQARYGSSDKHVIDTARKLLLHELEVLDDLELSDFFLVVHEVVVQAKRRGIRSSGRGSAANSIVAYVLFITHVCPVRHHLLFERFLHRGRKGTPDIDVDFDSERRLEMISWMEQRFGLNHTAMTATLITYKMRMALRDAAKVIGYPEEIITRITRSVPSWTSLDVDCYRNELATVTGNTPALNILITAAQLLIDHPRHLGQHSGGMILSSKPLELMTPIQRSANGVAVVQFDKDDVESMGLVKFDVLGLRMLSCISECVEIIAADQGLTVDIDHVPLDDPDTFTLIRTGKTLGIFQIESQGQMHLLAKHQPECFDDLVTEVALFRPGPLQAGMVHPYIARRTKQSPIEYLHPDLEPILSDTLGIVLFQEQVLEIAHKFAGMPLDQADEFRTLVSKNRNKKLMSAMRDVFINGAVSRGIDVNCAEKVYEIVSHFVGYGFCRSHAAAFARIVYQSAWLKTHYPAAYMAAFMQHRPGMYNLMTLEEESRRFGVEVLAPDIHRSNIRYSLEPNGNGSWSIRKPLTSIRNVSAEIAQQIIYIRSRLLFSSIEDLAIRLSGISADTLNAIALSGALSSIEDNPRKAMWIMGVIRNRHTDNKSELFDTTYVLPEEIPKFEVFRAHERLAYDYLTHGAARIHPMTLYRRQLARFEVRSIETLQRMPTDFSTMMVTAGIVMLRQAPPTANGMLFVTIEDETGYLQCVVPPAVRASYKLELRNAALIMKGQVTGIGNWRSMVVSEVYILHNVIGGYHGHLSYAGGRDQMEIGDVVKFA